jgi:hypothetical protein
LQHRNPVPAGLKWKTVSTALGRPSTVKGASP